MPEAIAYCDECARRIPGADIKSGEAIVTPDGAICATCLDALGPEKREALKKLVAGEPTTGPPSSVMPAPRPKRPPTRSPTPGKAAPSGQRRRPACGAEASSARRRPDQAAREDAPRRKTIHTAALRAAREPDETRSKAGTMVMAGAAVGLIAGVLALMLVSSGPSRERERRRRAASAPPAVAPSRQADTAGSEGGRPGTGPPTPQRGGLARLGGPLPPHLDFSRPTRPAPVVPVTPPGRPGSSTPTYSTRAAAPAAKAGPGRVSGAAAGRMPPDVTRGPVAHWTFDETEGTAAGDSSGKGNGGRLHGNPEWLPGGGRIGGALAFFGYDGSDDYVEVANSPSLEDVQEGNYTLTAWVCPESLPQGTAEDRDPAYSIITKEGRRLGLEYSGDQTFALTHSLSGDTCVRAASTDVYAPGAFHHVAGVVSKASGKAELYVDGRPAGSKTFTAGTAGKDYGVIPWRIGTAAPEAAPRSGECPATEGKIDDVRVYDRALAAAEVEMLYRDAEIAARIEAAGGLVAHWTFDETDGTTASDSSGNDFHGALLNMTLPATSVEGVVDTAFVFDGAGQGVDCGNPVVIGSLTELTVMCWVKSEDSVTDGAFGDPMVCKEGGGDGFQLTWQHRGGTGRFGLMTRNVGDMLWSNSDKATGTWYHVAASWSVGDGMARIYVNGVLEAEGRRTCRRNSVNALLIGRYGVRSLAATIDDVRIYNRALTADEIGELYRSAEAGGTRVAARASSHATPAEEDWITIFNGRDMSGWRHEGGPARVEDGALVATDNADLFYKADWTEFELAAEIKAGDGRGGSVMGLGLAASKMGRGSWRVVARFYGDGDLHVSAQKRRIWQAGPGKLPLGSWLPVRLVMTRDSLAVYRGETLLGTVDLSGVPLKKGGVYFYVNVGPTARLRNARVRLLHDSGQPKSPGEAAKEGSRARAGAAGPPPGGGSLRRVLPEHDRMALP